MRLRIIWTFALLFVLSESFSQYYTSPDDFNKLSIDGSAGFAKPYRSFTEGAWTPKVGLLSTDFGVRYMFNEYFGLKYDLGYSQYNSAEASLDFSTDQYKTSLQGVINAGRILKFQSWTKTFNLLVHGGIGIGSIKYHEPTYSNDIDDVVNAVAGLTGQVKLSDRVALNLNINGLLNFKQDHSFDGGIPNSFKAGMIINGTVGVSVYLGKKKSHADWYLREDALYTTLNSNIDNLKDGLESSSKQIEVGDNQFNHLKEQVVILEKQIQEMKELASSEKDLNQVLKENVINELIDSEYLNIYFDFNSAQIDKNSFGTINFLMNYMTKNPDFRIKLEGYADESGDEDYNLNLSQQRADEVKNCLIELGLDTGNVLAVGKGEVVKTEAQSKLVRQLARRVSVNVFQIN